MGDVGSAGWAEQQCASQGWFLGAAGWSGGSAPAGRQMGAAKGEGAQEAAVQRRTGRH